MLFNVYFLINFWIRISHNFQVQFKFGKNKMANFLQFLICLYCLDFLL